MKKQIRQRVFETNSSSTHSICIARNPVLSEIPSSLNFKFGSFGWEVDKLTSIKEKASYLYTCISYLDDIDKIKECLQFITNSLIEYGVEDIYFDNFELSPFCNGINNVDIYICPGDEGYVDHGREAIDFVEAVCSDKHKLINYLFSEQSFILTGNDNDEIGVDINVDYDYDEYFKGN